MVLSMKCVIQKLDFSGVRSAEQYFGFLISRRNSSMLKHLLVGKLHISQGKL